MEERVSAVAVVEGKGSGCDVLGDPVWIARLAVEGGEVGWGSGKVGDGSGEAVLEDAGRGDGGDGGWTWWAAGRSSDWGCCCGTWGGGRRPGLLLRLGRGGEDGGCDGRASECRSGGNEGEGRFGHDGWNGSALYGGRCCRGLWTESSRTLLYWL